MIIDGRNFATLSFNRYSSNQQIYRARSEDEYNALVRDLDKSSDGYGIKILQDYHLDRSDEKFDGFQTDFGTVNNAKNIIGSNIKEVVFSLAYQQDYTAQDAFYNSWVSSTGGNLNNAAVKDSAIVGMGKEDFLGYIRENGLDKEIDWNSVSVNFRGAYTFDKFTDYTNYAAALYTSLEDRINKDFAGDERAKQLDTLNKKFETAVNDTIKFTIGELERTYDEMGIVLPKEELAQSIRGIIDDKKQAYQSYIKENADYAGLGNNEDKWLERDVGYMANALRNSFTPSAPLADKVTENEYSESDIITIGFISNMFSNHNASLSFDDEESIGLALSMNYLMLNKAVEEFGASDNVKGLSEQIFKKYANDTINKQNEYLTFSRNNLNTTDPERFASLDIKSIYNVLNHMKASYEKNQNAEDAVSSTVRFAYEQFKAKEKDTDLWRYGTSDNMGRGGKFWNKLYDDGKGGSNMKKILDRWSLISGAIGTNDLSVLSLRATARLFHSYSTTKTVHISGGYSAETGWWGTNLIDYALSK